MKNARADRVKIIVFLFSLNMQISQVFVAVAVVIA